jgi:hypothetical protein
MLLAIAAAAAFIVSDGYDPAGDVAWLCPQPETAAQIGLKVDRRASPGLISALAQARKCVSWERGTLNVREAKHVGVQEIGLIRIIYGEGPEISYWVARNTVRWTKPGKRAGRAP